jgi:Heparinase II/III-like protein.
MFSEYLQANPILPLLAPQGERIAYPKADEREKWAAIDIDFKAQIIAAAKEYAQIEYPTLTADLFISFTRDGNRKIFENPYFLRRKKLIASVLYECLTLDGLEMDNIINGIWLICEESSWVVSAHNGSGSTAEKPLPDVQNPYIDLFAAQTAATLALVCHLLEDKLNAVTPLIVRRVASEMETRIFTPFFTRDDFWWMGMIPTTINNWTPWILSSLLPCLAVFEKDALRLAEGIERAMRMLDSYVAVMPEDGGCDEGASYWNVAGASLLDCLESIQTLTAGKISFYNHPHIAAIGLFPANAHIHGPYYWDFADCDARPILDGERLYTYGNRIKNNRLRDLGASLAWEDRVLLPKDTPQFARVLDRLFTIIPRANMPKSADVILPDLQVWAKCSGDLYAAIKGGHNSESHNHNDVGSFILYNAGEPVLIDVGNMVYTAKTFGPDRYTLFNTRSRNHNLPLIGEYEQQVGGEKKALEVVLTDDFAQMDLRACYPDEAGIVALNRRLEQNGDSFFLTDAIQLRQAAKITWVFMLAGEPQLGNGILVCRGVKIRFNAELAPSVEAIEITDARMARNFPGFVYRVTLQAPESLAREERFTLTRR